HHPSLCTHPSTTELHTLSLHDALPIFLAGGTDTNTDAGIAQGSDEAHSLMRRAALVLSTYARPEALPELSQLAEDTAAPEVDRLDRKSTRLNSSHVKISYAVFCLKKKK